MHTWRGIVHDKRKISRYPPYTPPISMFVRHPQRSDLIVRYCHSKTTTYYAMFVAYLRQLTKNREKYNLREETLTILCIFYLVANVLMENVILKYYKKLISRKNYRFHKKIEFLLHLLRRIYNM